MQGFVNREPELRIIEEAFSDLLNQDRLVRTPIIDFYGVEGIGKTSLLERVVQKCDEMHIPHIRASASKDLLLIERNIIEQARRYANQVPLPLENVTSLEQLVVQSTQDLLKDGPLVMLLDSIDTTNESQLEWLEKMLSKLAVHNRFFVVVTSRRRIFFEKEKTIARKLKSVAVTPLDRTSSEEYLNQLQQVLTPPYESRISQMRELIFEWTQGYPIAMNAMVDIIAYSDVNPQLEQGRIELIRQIVDRVITQGLLKDIRPEEQNWLQKALRLLAVPRRFNLVIMQKLIEEFEPDLKLGKSLSYIVLPNRITQATEVLGWRMEKAGFAIEDPIRRILLLQWKIEQPQLYREINQRLAELNWNNARASIGPDHIRYQREYFYHSANSVEPRQLPLLLRQAIEQIILEAEEEPDRLVQFVQEFMLDKELKEALGPHMTIVQHLLYENLAQKMYEAYEQEDDEDKRRDYLHYFFYYTVHDPEAQEIKTAIRQRLLQLLEKERAAFVLALYEELGRDKQFKEALGADFEILYEVIRHRFQ